MTMEQTGDDQVAPIVEYASHKRQFSRFVHLTKWFVIHILLLLAAVYFFLVASQSVSGVMFLALAIGALGYGIISTPQIARDVNAAVSGVNDPS